MSDHEKYMQRAIEIAKKGLGYVSPNPLVGCVIVKDDKIVSEGWHEKFGEAHAEVNAVNKLGKDNLSGHTVYVNLEPCTHHGKTPPCTDLLIEKKPDKVVIAMRDPNHLVSGNGVTALQEAGIKVIVGILKEEAKELNQAFITNVELERPFIAAKLAMTLDGFIAMQDKTSKWITDETSRKESHRLRSQFDAVAVGSGTVRADDPQLNVRHIEGKDPKRIVITSNLIIPMNARVLTDEKAKENTIIVCTNEAENIKKVDKLRNAGIKVYALSKEEKGQVDLNRTLEELLEKENIGRVMIESGSKLLSSFYKNDLIDEIYAFISPKIIGKGISPFNETSSLKLADAYRFRIKENKLLKNDVYLKLVREKLLG